MQAISARINLYMQEIMGLSSTEAQDLRKKFKQKYGTTLQGLHDIYGIEKEPFLEYVHDIDLSQYLQPDDNLTKVLQAYPHKKVVFSNADNNHILKVLDFLGIRTLFDQIIDVHAMDPFVKPEPESFERCLEILGLSTWSECVFIDDYLPNIYAALSQGLFSIQVDESLKTDYPKKISHLYDLPTIIPFK